MEEPKVRFQEEENVEIEYEEEAIEEDSETYQQFVTLVDGVVNCLALLQTEMDNYLYFKDELMQQMLPPNLLLQLSLISGKLYRSYSDLQIPLWELLRLVRVYSSPWEEKRAALQKMHDDYSRKKQQLEVALRRLTTQDADVQRAARWRRVMNWERLFARVQMARGHGRRWKFRMYDFKRRAALGVEHLGKYFAEEQSDLESEPEEPPLDVEDDEGNEEKEAATDEEAAKEAAAGEGGDGGVGEAATAEAARQTEEEFPDIQLEAFSEAGSDEAFSEQQQQQQQREPTDPISLVSLPTEVVVVETADAAAWTHEQQFVERLHLRVWPAKNVKAKQVTVEISFGDSSRRLEAQDVALRAADERRRMKRVAVKAPDGADDAEFEAASFQLPTSPEFGSPAPQLQLAVANERMDEVGQLAMSLQQLRDAELPTFDVAPPADETATDDGEERGEAATADERVDGLAPVDYPLLLDDAEAGQLPVLMYWTRWPVYRTADSHNNTASVYELVEDLTGIDLHKVTKEELTREKVDACMSPRPLTPQAENVPKEELDKLNEEFTERMQQLEEEYVSKLKDLEAKLTEARASSVHDSSPAAAAAAAAEAAPVVETSERATSAQRSLPGSRRSSARSRRRSPQEEAPPAAGVNGEGDDEAATATATKKKKVLRLPARPPRPKKNFLVGRPLPAWGESFPDDFFERMELLTNLTKEHKEQLVAKIRAEIARQVEAQLEELSRLSRLSRRAAAGDDGDGDEEEEEGEAAATTAIGDEEVTIPALFMPQRGERKVYNPRAHQYFQPHGLRGARLTQPPAMLSLPPLHNGPSVLNLFDLGVRSSHAGYAGGSSSLGSAPPPNSVIQTQLNLLRKAAN